MNHHLSKPRKPLSRLPLSASALAVALSMGSVHAATVQPWKCKADQGQWVCTALPSHPSLYQKNLSKAQRQEAIANALGWVPDGSDNPGNCSVCGGHYVEPPFPQQGALSSLSAAPALGSYSHATYQVNGDVVLQGPIELTQPSRSLFVGGQATLFPDVKTGQLNRLSANGDIQLHQPGQLLLGSEGAADLFKHQAELQNATYLVQVKPNWQAVGDTTTPDPNFTGYAYGQATSINQESQNIVILHDTTYTTCPPTSNTWQLSAEKIVLNKDTERGEAQNTVLKLFNIPVFYTPYLDFPLTSKRKSGFLYGNIGSSGSSGYALSTPYYFNLAPNYDDTFTPTIYTKGGVLFENEFRYINSWLTSQVDGAFVPHDWIRGLGTRGEFDTTDTANLSPNWVANLNYNYISDDYFLQDFDSTNAVTANQVLLNRQFDVNYTGLHWQFTGLVQSYQVINDLLFLQNQPYERLPELDLSAEYPDALSPLALSFTSQLVNFQQSIFQGQVPVNGQRANLTPQLSLPLVQPFGYFTPSLNLSATNYHLENNSAANGFPNTNIQRSIPIFDVDSGLSLSRDFNFLNNSYTQTLQPRFFYLAVPYENQNNIPIFDTTLQNFTYDSLFNTNRFSGIDRIGDANQLSYAISSNINNSLGQTLVSGGVGQTAYFTDRRVQLCQENSSNPDCAIQASNIYNTSRFSDYAGYLDYTLASNWNLNTDLTYNPYLNQLDYQSYQLQYKPDQRHVFNIGYQNNQIDYALLSMQGLLTGAPPPVLSQLTTSFVWGLTPTWSGIGQWNYAFNASRVVSEFAGIEYNACCWAVRFVYGYYVSDTNPNTPSTLSGPLASVSMIQFELKGLGSTSNADIESLEQQIPGYTPNQSGFN